MSGRLPVLLLLGVFLWGGFGLARGVRGTEAPDPTRLSREDRETFHRQHAVARGIDVGQGVPASRAGALLVLGFMVVAGRVTLAALGWHGLPGEAVALSFVLGSGLVTLEALCASALFGGRVPPGWALLLPWLPLLLLRRSRTRPLAAGCTLSGVVLLLPFAFVLSAAASSGLAAWDAWAVWGLKARAIFGAGGAVGPAFAAGPEMAFSHPGYPLAFPLAEALLWWGAGAPEPVYAKVLGPLHLLAAATLAMAACRHRGTWAVPLLAGWLVLTTPALVHLARAGYADVPLAAAAVAATVSLLRWSRSGSAADLIVAGLAAGTAAWTKNEGWAVVAGVALAVLVRVPREVARVLIPALVMGLPWVLWRWARGIPFDPLGGPPVLEGARALGVAVFLGGETLALHRWLVLWPIALVGLALGIRRRRRVPAAALVPVAMLAASGLALAIAPADLSWIISRTGWRLLAQAAPAALAVGLVAGVSPEPEPEAVDPGDPGPLRGEVGPGSMRRNSPTQGEAG